MAARPGSVDRGTLFPGGPRRQQPQLDAPGLRHGLRRGLLASRRRDFPHGNTLHLAQLDVVVLHEVAHHQGRIACVNGVILVRDWRTEERHDPVAHHLIHGALVAVDSLHHPL
jgi:hypothetical protein